MPTLFSAQPYDTILHSLTFLEPKELEEKRRIAKYFASLCHENVLWDKFLQQEYRINSNEPAGSAREIYYKRPEYRLSYYQSYDQFGRDWLNDLLLDKEFVSIKDLAKLITGGILTLEKARNLIALKKNDNNQF